ncbi:phosphotransacetylase family protein, partial [Arthrobacter sp. HMWF013]|uniref:phosphotransacetylase family protein n=1 Tax=Arthrobacter sp. HMWF013 TaxID=2056849 RepID=UPI000D4725DF
MAKGIYVSATTPGSGKSLVALGLADTLHRHADRIGFFKPVVHGPDAAQDPMVALMKARFALDDDRCRGGLTFAEVRALLAEGRRADIDARCVEIFAEISRHCDVVIVEGTDLTGQDAAVEFDLNARLANNLAAPVVAVVGAKGRTVAETAAAVEVARKELVAEKCTLLAIMVNRADPELLDAIAAEIKPGASNRPVYVLPELEEIARPTTGEVAAALGVRQVAGRADMERDVRDIKVAAMNVGHFLNVLDDGALVIVPGDRADVMVACLASSFSPEFPVPSGLILTGGLAPDDNIYPLLAQAPFPVFATTDDTYTTAKRVSEVRSEIWSG